MERRVSVFVMSILLIIQLIFNSKIAIAGINEKRDINNTQDKYSRIVSILNGFAKKVAYKEKNTWIDVQVDYYSEHSGEKLKLKDVKLGTPFFVFNPEREYQTPEVNYPIEIKKNRKIIGVFSCFWYHKMWHMSSWESGGDSNLDVICDIDYEKDNPIFYVTGDTPCGEAITMETKDSKYEYGSMVKGKKTTKKQKDFQKLSYEQRMDYILEHISNFGEDKVVSVDMSIDKEENIKKESKNTDVHSKTNKGIATVIEVYIVVFMAGTIFFMMKKRKH